MGFAWYFVDNGDDSDPNGDFGNVDLNQQIVDFGSSYCVDLRGARHIRQFGRTVRSGKLMDGTVVASEAYLVEVEGMALPIEGYSEVPYRSVRMKVPVGVVGYLGQHEMMVE